MPITGVRTKLEYDDLAHVPDDGNIYEILDGGLYVTASPSPLHQRVSKRLQRQLEAYFEGRRMGEVFNAPLDVILSKKDVVQPDVMVVANAAQVSGRAIEGPPLVLVEILSPSSVDRDRGVKASRYAALGVPHYWIADLDASAIECYRLADDAARYALVVRADAPAELRHPAWPGLALDTAAIWGRS
jgi:Uma2 family endonuclease